MKKFAWFSEMADRQFGSAVYLISSGERVKVCEVVDGIDELSIQPLSAWPDLIFVGEVTKFIKAAPDDWLDEMLGNSNSWEDFG